MNTHHHQIEPLLGGCSSYLNSDTVDHTLKKKEKKKEKRKKKRIELNNKYEYNL